MNEVIDPQLQTWARQYVKQIGSKVRPLPASRQRKLLMVHLDGVPKVQLDAAIRSGQMPFLARLITSGAYAFDDAFWGSPASTPFFQAGLLYGLRHPNLPAYSWFDRELGRKVQMNTPADALAMETRLGQRTDQSLLAGGGHGYFSLFRAQANNRLCMSTVASFKTLVRSIKYEMTGIVAGRTQSPLKYLRTFGREAWNAFQEVRRWARAVGDWRHEQGFLVSRVFLQRLGWSFAHTKAMVDMVRGVPAIYLVYGNYDEVAHRRGPRSEQALTELRRVDAYLAELYAVSKAVNPGYDLVFLTDHGHVDSHAIEKRTGQRLEKLLLEGAAPPLAEDVRRALLDGAPAVRGDARPGSLGARGHRVGQLLPHLPHAGSPAARGRASSCRATPRWWPGPRAMRTSASWRCAGGTRRWPSSEAGCTGRRRSRARPCPRSSPSARWRTSCASCPTWPRRETWCSTARRYPRAARWASPGSSVRTAA